MVLWPRIVAAVVAATTSLVGIAHATAADSEPARPLRVEAPRPLGGQVSVEVHEAPTTAPPPPPPTTAPPPPPPPSVPAATPRTAPRQAPAPAPQPSIQQRGEAALALIGYPWQRTGYRIAFAPGRSGLQGLTNRIERTITIYVRPTDTTHRLAFVLAHEIAHAVDFTILDGDDRARWMEARGFGAGTAWFGCSACDDLATPAGDWAESFAAWQVGPGREFASRLGPPPSAEQLAVLSTIAG